MAQVHKEILDGGRTRVRVHILASEVVALGDTASSGQISLGVSIPAGAKLERARVENGGTLVATLTSLTASLGTSGGSYVDVLPAGTVFAASVVHEQQPVEEVSASARALSIEFVGNDDLATLTGGSPGGFDVLLEWRELQS